MRSSMFFATTAVMTIFCGIASADMITYHWSGAGYGGGNIDSGEWFYSVRESVGMGIQSADYDFTADLIDIELVSDVAGTRTYDVTLGNGLLEFRDNEIWGLLAGRTAEFDEITARVFEYNHPDDIWGGYRLDYHLDSVSSSLPGWTVDFNINYYGQESPIIYDDPLLMADRVSHVSITATGPASIVPEPATMTLLGLGLAGLAVAKRRKRK